MMFSDSADEVWTKARAVRTNTKTEAMMKLQLNFELSLVSVKSLNVFLALESAPPTCKKIITLPLITSYKESYSISACPLSLSSSLVRLDTRESFSSNPSTPLS